MAMNAETQPPGWRGAFIAMLRAPFRYPAWRDTAQVLLAFPIAIVAGTVVLTLTLTTAALAITAVLAIPFLIALFACSRTFSGRQRSRLQGFCATPLPPLTKPAQAPTWWRRLWLNLRTPNVWRQVGYQCLSLITASVTTLAVTAFWTLGFIFSTITLVGWALPETVFLNLPMHNAAFQILVTIIGLVLFFAAPAVAGLAAYIDAALVRWMLSPSRSEELTRQVEVLAESRADVIDAADAERPRIERDLHDGTQQRLVSLAMNLGMTRTTMTDVPEPVRVAIEQAHDEAKLALSELRDFVRGLHPAVLDDLGLDAALSGIAARSAIPVRLMVELPVRPPRAAETVAYFVVSEALTNAAKHSGATVVDVVVEYTDHQNTARENTAPDNLLRVIVSDNGTGGADPARGTGLQGLSQRIRALDGLLTVQSPPGGPTVLVADLPCAVNPAPTKGAS
jgi:signal transduction histidine kinase